MYTIKINLTCSMFLFLTWLLETSISIEHMGFREWNVTGLGFSLSCVCLAGSGGWLPIFWGAHSCPGSGGRRGREQPQSCPLRGAEKGPNLQQANDLLSGPRALSAGPSEVLPLCFVAATGAEEWRHPVLKAVSLPEEGKAFRRETLGR